MMEYWNDGMAPFGQFLLAFGEENPRKNRSAAGKIIARLVEIVPHAEKSLRSQ